LRAALPLVQSRLVDRRSNARSGARRAIAVVAVLLLLVAGSVATWRLAVQRVNLVIVNQSGVEAQLTWQPSLFAVESTIRVGGCESRSMDLGGGQTWRLEADGLDINANAVDRPWLTPMVAFEIWLDAGGSSRINGPHAVSRPISAPNPSSCTVAP
jgi:hypothetical protein